MKPYKYFENIIKDRSKERDTDISDELAKREVDTIFFLLKKFYGIVFTGTTNTVVDIGCGDGYLGKFFEKRGFSYKGYDIDDFIEKVIPSKSEKINIFVLYPTSIFVDKNTIIKCSKMLKKTEYVTAVKKFPHPIERALEFRDKRLKPINIKKKVMRTQDLKHYYYNSGQLDLFKLDAWIKKKIFYNMNVKFLVFKELDSVDIDNHEDLELAKKIFKLKKN